MNLFPADSSSDEERPLELLYACHERMRRFSATAGRLAEHIGSHGADAEAQEAARNVLRYFETALLDHHADEEEDVFPALRHLGDAALNRTIDELLAQHAALDSTWQEVRPWLLDIAAGKATAAPAVLAGFVRDYPAHAELEERKVFSAIERLPAEIVDAIAQCMRARRGG